MTSSSSEGWLGLQAARLRHRGSRWPPPPSATAEEARAGKLMLLYDPGFYQDGWTGTFRDRDPGAGRRRRGDGGRPAAWRGRLVVADRRPRPARARLRRAERYRHPGDHRRVRREVRRSSPSTGFELRASSWCPADGGDAGLSGGDADELATEIGGAVVAWCELLASAAGLLLAGHARDRHPGREGAGERTRRAGSRWSPFPVPAGGDADDDRKRGIRGADAGGGGGCRRTLTVRWPTVPLLTVRWPIKASVADEAAADGGVAADEKPERRGHRPARGRARGCRR